MTKNARLAQIRTLVPRELYKHQDAYENEVEKVYNYKNISDEQIADIYNTKLRSIDLGQRRGGGPVKQHGSSSMQRSKLLLKKLLSEDGNAPGYNRTKFHQSFLISS